MPDSRAFDLLSATAEWTTRSARAHARSHPRTARGSRGCAGLLITAGSAVSGLKIDLKGS